MGQDFLDIQYTWYLHCTVYTVESNRNLQVLHILHLAAETMQHKKNMVFQFIFLRMRSLIWSYLGVPLKWAMRRKNIWKVPLFSR